MHKDFKSNHQFQMILQPFLKIAVEDYKLASDLFLQQVLISLNFLSFQREE